MLVQAMEQLGGDPTAQTPCADVTATASMGLIQVVTDPRTTLAQSLNAAGNLLVENIVGRAWQGAQFARRITAADTMVAAGER